MIDDFKRVQALLGLLEKDMRAALRTATRKAGQWANREGSRGLAKAANVPLKNLKQGLRIKFGVKSAKGHTTANLWFGLNSISLKYLGAKQQKKGVRARGQSISGAFVSGKLGGHVYKRSGDSRLPIEEQDFEIEEKATKYVESLQGDVLAKFSQFFFEAIDKLSGRDSGDSQAITGGLKMN